MLYIKLSHLFYCLSLTGNKRQLILNITKIIQVLASSIILLDISRAELSIRERFLDYNFSIAVTACLLQLTSLIVMSYLRNICMHLCM